MLLLMLILTDLHTDWSGFAMKGHKGFQPHVMDLQTDAVLAVFQRGLQDGYSVEVCLADLFVAQLLTG